MAGPSLLSMLEMLPEILGALQTIMYIVLSWILGSLAFFGMRKKLPLAIKLIVTFGVGFLSLLMGVTLSKYMPFFEGTIFQTAQMDIFIGGIIGALIAAAAFYMITRKEGGEDKKGMLKKLQERISLLTGLLLKNHVPTLKEDQAKKTAETLVPGFDAKSAHLKRTDWEILLEKGEKQAVVIIGAYTGEVKKVQHLGMGSLLYDPLRIVGIAVIIGFVAFALLNFTGFPSLIENVASLLGMTPEQFETFTGEGSENLPENCVPAFRILMGQGVSILGGENSYKNDDVKAMVEAESGRNVALMYKTDFEGSEYILSITLPPDFNFADLSNEEIIDNAEICVSTQTIFCECVSIPQVTGGMPTGFIIAL